MNDILSKTFYGNTVQQWLVVAGIIVLSFLMGKIIYWISGRFLKRLALKTKTKLDYIIIDMFEEPIVLIIITLGTWLACNTLSLPAKFSFVVNNLFQGTVILTITWLIVRFFDALCEEYVVPLAEKTETDLDDQLLPIVRKGMKITAWTVAFIVALNNAGYNVGALIAGLGIGGIAIAMAAKVTVANIFGGVTIYMDRPFKVKDRIQIDGFDGRVTEIGLRSTRIRTLLGRTVIIPNSKFAESEIENISEEPCRKVKVELGITYDTPPEKIKEALCMLETIAKSNKGTTDDCIASFNSFGDFYLGITLVYYVVETESEADILNVQSAVSLEILNEFNQRNIEFAFPTQTIHANLTKSYEPN